MIFNTRDTVIIGNLEYICYLENDRLGILIQKFFPDKVIGEIIDNIEFEKEYFYFGIEGRGNERYLVFKRDKSKLLDLSKLFSD